MTGTEKQALIYLKELDEYINNMTDAIEACGDVVSDAVYENFTGRRPEWEGIAYLLEDANE